MSASILWFRKGLRLHDNQALIDSIEKMETMNPIFILDPYFVRSGSVGSNRMNFLFESLKDLDKSLRSKNSRLMVFKGCPEEVFERIFSEFKIARLTFERDTEPYARKRDEAIAKLAKRYNVEVRASWGHTLYCPVDTIQAAGGKAPKTYQSFLAAIKKMPPPLPAAASDKLGLPPPSIPHSEVLTVPSLAEIEYEAATTPFVGGESEAVARMERFLSDKARVAKFEKPNTSPAMFDDPSTTVLRYAPPPPPMDSRVLRLQPLFQVWLHLPSCVLPPPCASISRSESAFRAPCVAAGATVLARVLLYYRV